MNHRPAFAGTLAAIAITATMDAAGPAAFSALPLAPLLALCWYLRGFSRSETGFILGGPRHYGMAVGYPLSLMSMLAIPAWLAGAIETGLAYVLFGPGDEIGALGVRQAWVFDPEVGVVGLLLNLAFAALVGWGRVARIARRAGPPEHLRS